MKSFKKYLEDFKKKFQDKKGTPVYIEHGSHSIPKNKRKKQIKEDNVSSVKSPNIIHTPDFTAEMDSHDIFNQNKHLGANTKQIQEHMENAHNYDILDERQRLALDNYTDNSRVLNENLYLSHLRGENYNHPDIEHLDGALSTFKLHKPLTVFSGLKFNPGLLASQNSSHRLFMPSYTSTSIKPHVAAQFVQSLRAGTSNMPIKPVFGNEQPKDEDRNLDRHILRINLQKGNHGLYIGSRSQLDHEYEHLLPRNLSLQINKTPTIFVKHNPRLNITHNNHIWDAHVVNHKD